MTAYQNRPYFQHMIQLQNIPFRLVQVVPYTKLEQKQPLYYLH